MTITLMVATRSDDGGNVEDKKEGVKEALPMMEMMSPSHPRALPMPTEISGLAHAGDDVIHSSSRAAAKEEVEKRIQEVEKRSQEVMPKQVGAISSCSREVKKSRKEVKKSGKTSRGVFYFSGEIKNPKTV